MNLFYQQAKKLFKTWPFFLLLLPLFFIYSGSNELFGFLSLKFVALNFCFILFGIFLLLASSVLIFRNIPKASVFTFFISLISLTFGYLHDSIKQFTGVHIQAKFILILPILLVFILLILIYLQKRKRGFTDLYSFLNMLFIILLLSEIPNSIRRYKLDQSVHNLIDFRFSAFHEYKPSQHLPDSLKPDIYFLVFDALASSKGLEANLGKTNYQLDSFLSQKGFYVAANSSANYNWTIHSLSSTFNMDYLPNWIAPVMNDPKAYFWGSASILNNSLFSILKKEGYQTYSYQPVSFSNTDWPGESYFISLKKNHFYYKTLPGRIYRDIFWNYSKIDIDFVRDQQMQIIEQRNRQKKIDTDTTKALIKNSCSQTGKPKFIYGHFMVPHDPYTFDSTGKLKSAEEMVAVKRKENNSDDYFNQVIYAGKVIKELVTYIQQHNKRNTIIIVEGDHGYRTETGDLAGYSFQNMSSFYFPDQKYDLLYDSLSPVNTFRIVLNKYFAAGLPLLKDSNILVLPNKETIIKSEKIKPGNSNSQLK